MARKALLLTASALVLAPPAVAAAYPSCGGSTFSTCASIAINKVLRRDGNVRVRMERMSEAALAYTREGAPLGLIEQWRLPEEKGRAEAKLSVETRVKATQWRDDNEAAADVRQNGTRGEKGRPVARLEGDDRGAVVLVARRRPPEFVELDLSKARNDDVASNDDDDDKDSGDKNDRAACSNDVAGGAEGKGSVLCESVVVPEPSSFVLLASALAGLSAMRWRRRQQ